MAHHTTELDGFTVTASQEQALREFTEGLEPCYLRTALYDVLDGLREHRQTCVTTADFWTVMDGLELEVGDGDMSDLAARITA